MSERSDSAELPAVLPIFPLTGVLLLPRGRLPLNIFEPRYLAMTRDALAGERLIGMVQPSGGGPESPKGRPPVYPTGCAGRITAFAETEDGRFLITLTGVSRFRIREELPLLRGYRRVVPDWSEFAADREAGEAEIDRDRLLRGLEAFFQRHQLSADWASMRGAPAERLVTTIAMVCPFEPSEKQALLEAPNLAERARLLTAIVEMAAATRTPDGGDVRH